MIDSSRRTVLTTGAAAAAATTNPQVFAQAPQARAPQGLPAGTKFGFYEKGNIRIRYAEIGLGFPLLATPGGGLNSRVSVWPTAVINIMEEFKNDFRVITMDQRNATNGDSTAGSGRQSLGRLRRRPARRDGSSWHSPVFFFGNCIGGPFGMKLMERAPERVVAAILSQPVGHRPEQPDYMYNSGKDVWAKEFRERQPDVSMATIEAYLRSLYRVRPDFVYSVSRDFAKSCQTPILVLPDDITAHPLQVSIDIASLAPNAEIT